MVEFSWPEGSSELREKLRRFLDDELPDWWGPEHQTLVSGPEVHEFCAEFAPRLAEAGFHVPHWPQQYGGSDASPWYHLIVREELWRRGEPRGQQYMGANWVGPAIIRHGTEDQKERFLPDIGAGRVLWCQGFSEPDSGSDLASLRTSAKRDGEEYVVNGEKIWTSYADLAEWCFLLARTNPSTSDRSGISVLLMDMESPGLSIRPIPTVIGEHGFSSLHLEEVRVPLANRLGEENAGWQVVLDALAFERAGAPRYERALYLLHSFLPHMEDQGLLEDAEVRRRLGRVLAAIQMARLLTYKVVDGQSKDRPPGVEGNVARVASVQAEQLTMDTISELIGDHAFDGAPAVTGGLQSAMTAGIAGGTMEINLNLVARSLLGSRRR